MNTDVLQGMWKQVRGEARKQWGKLTDDELDQAQGSSEKLTGLIQEKYGYARERAEREVNDFLARFKGGADARNRETV